MKNYVLIFLLLFMSISAKATVNPKNGDFHKSYTDLVVLGAVHPLEIKRTYHSQSTYDGWFGYGWGSEYETFLTHSKDGAILIHQNGSGSTVRFTSTQDKNKFYCNHRCNQTLVITESGYKRIMNSNREELFSRSGKLTHIKRRHGYLVTLIYDTDNKIEKIADTQGIEFKFEWYKNQKVKHITASNGDISHYRFNGSYLVQSVGSSGTTYTFDYDQQHNLNTIIYADKRQQTIRYQEGTHRVNSVKLKGGESKEYKYGVSEDDPDYHYWTDITTNSKYGSQRTKRYEYQDKLTDDGVRYTYKEIIHRNGIKEETTYNEDSQPVRITRGRFETNFTYDQGKLIEKTNSEGDFYYIQYDANTHKVSQLTDRYGWRCFSYNKSLDLIRVVTSQDEFVNFVYDNLGRIIQMSGMTKRDKKEKTIEYAYNRNGRYDSIKVSDVGSIELTYDPNGEILDVFSQGGQDIKREVVTSVQELLAIARPRGIDLDI